MAANTASKGKINMVFNIIFMDKVYITFSIMPEGERICDVFTFCARIMYSRCLI